MEMFSYGLTQNFLFNIKKWIFFFPLVKSDISGKVIKTAFSFFKIYFCLLIWLL